MSDPDSTFERGLEMYQRDLQEIERRELRQTRLASVENQKNSKCCQNFINCLYYFKEGFIICLSAFYGFTYIFQGIIMVCFLLPINLYQTIDTQTHKIDLSINVGLTMMSLADILFGIVLMTLTQK
jgi:hypothetical protein